MSLINTKSTLGGSCCEYERNSARSSNFLWYVCVVLHEICVAADYQSD
ncbi:Uncharacterised protein [Vibrio cholerae]|nr:Uncharacterised protein [Vibrio cholerae]